VIAVATPTAAGPATAATSEPLRIAIVAGESSGDQLGAALITAMRARVPDVQFFGIAGPKMIAAGCDAWAPSEEIAVMGLAEVIPHLPRLLRLRSSMIARFRAARPHVFVGIDSPAFNLGLAKKIRSAECKTVQYVAPQVWAWRPGRVHGIGKACDLVLCLLPFEPKFFERHGVAATFVGHPLADQIPLEVDRGAARAALGLDPTVPIVALLPGSRLGEVEKLGTDFVRAAAFVAERRPDMRFISPMASARVRQEFERKIAEVPNAPEIRCLDGHAQQVLAAADAVIVASGTASLETLLSRRPMVVAYRFAAFTAFVLRALGMVKVQYFSQPNLLAGRALVPELLQEQVNGEALGSALLHVLDDRETLAEQLSEFHRIHELLRCGGADLAAKAILDCVRGKTLSTPSSGPADPSARGGLA
jgi:lipid-A-disaccharide synthase